MAGTGSRNVTTPSTPAAAVPLLSSTHVTLLALLLSSLLPLLLLTICILKRKSLYRIFTKNSKTKASLLALTHVDAFFRGRALSGVKLPNKSCG
jgi:hypothetical protein